MKLLNLIQDKYKIISIVGLAKNTGKTTTINHLINEAKTANIPVGITSIGRDGESIDLVTETIKPKINVYKDMLIATAEDLLPLGTAKINVIKRTNFRTVLGYVVIGRVKKPGSVQIAGPNSQREIKEVAEMMLSMGVKFVILDGAIDRRASASPYISEATILSTGAALSRDMEKVIEKTKHAIDILRLPLLEDEEAYDIISKLIQQNKVTIVDDDLNVNVINIETALGAGTIIGSKLGGRSNYIVIPNSLTSSLINSIIETKKYKDIEITVKDGSKIFIDEEDFKRYNYLGVKIKVIKKINLIALTINPTSPKGHNFNPEEFLEKMKASIDDIPILDLEL